MKKSLDSKYSFDKDEISINHLDLKNVCNNSINIEKSLYTELFLNMTFFMLLLVKFYCFKILLLHL